MLAKPEALVVAVALDSTALAPLAGAAKVTVTLGSGLLLASFTRTTNGLPNAVLTFVVCGLPELTAMEAAAAPLMSSVNVFLKVAEFASVTVRFTEFEPIAVGVPVIWPVVGLMLKPAGRPVADHAYGVVPPVAVTGAL